MQFVVIGNPANRRVTAFGDALKHLGAGKLLVIPYEDWLSGKRSLTIPRHSVVKIESPGEEDVVRKLLVERGLAHLVGAAYSEEFGVIQHMRAWYAGLCDMLAEADKVVHASNSIVMNRPADIRLQFDKPACQQLLEDRGVAVPLRLNTITGYEDLLTQMNHHRLSKVFVKPAHGSSASGVVAFRRQGEKVQAISSTELVRHDGQVKLYNSLKVRTYTNEMEIAHLINRLTMENIFAEAWIPKATLQGRYFDVRVLTVAGKARHVVVRTSRTIITNLHLGNQRGDRQACVELLGEERWRSILSLAEQAAGCFTDSLYMGIDILVTANNQQCFVLEVNAFGDLLPGLTDQGETCYEAQINAMLKRVKAEALC